MNPDRVILLMEQDLVKHYIDYVSCRYTNQKSLLRYCVET